MKQVERAFREWTKGCSNAPPAKPWECEACTQAFYERMQQLVGTSPDHLRHAPHMAAVRKWMDAGAAYTVKADPNN
ncbi:hypothetical protein J7E62_27680 [Variovorax paradoxus]|nr:hypothetical protein [Variovorax paradoxus]